MATFEWSSYDVNLDDIIIIQDIPFYGFRAIFRKLCHTQNTIPFLLRGVLETPFKSLFDGSSTDLSHKICCFEKLANTGAWLLGNELNSVTLYDIFNFGRIPVMIYILFGLTGGKTLYKEDTVDLS